jgi:hypothetical protein
MPISWTVDPRFWTPDFGDAKRPAPLQLATNVCYKVHGWRSWRRFLQKVDYHPDDMQDDRSLTFSNQLSDAPG